VIKAEIDWRDGRPQVSMLRCLPSFLVIGIVINTLIRCEQVIEGETIHVQVHLPAMTTVLNSQQKRLSLVVSALRENRLHVTSRSDDVSGHVTDDVIGQVVLVRADSQAPICALNFPLPVAERGEVDTSGRQVDEQKIERVLSKKKKSFEVDEDESKVELRLTDVADMVHADWQALATQLGFSDVDIDSILVQYSYPSEQVRLSAALMVVVVVEEQNFVKDVSGA